MKNIYILLLIKTFFFGFVLAMDQKIDSSKVYKHTIVDDLKIPKQKVKQSLSKQDFLQFQAECAKKIAKMQQKGQISQQVSQQNQAQEQKTINQNNSELLQDFPNQSYQHKKIIMPYLKKGILIAIEGIDGSGKSTLAQALHKKLSSEGYNTLLTKEPGDTPLGKKIRELVLSQNISIDTKAEYLLFAADRAQHFTEIIIPALKEKKLILSDRLADSSLAYQGYGRGLDVTMLATINKWAMQDIQPDFTVFVQAPINVIFERIKSRNTLSIFEKEAFLQKVMLGFETIYHNNRSDVIIINGTEEPQIVMQKTYDAILEKLENYIVHY